MTDKSIVLQTPSDIERINGRRPDFNFKAAANEHGYLKARQMLSDYCLQQEQKRVERSNTVGPMFELRHKLQSNDALKRSKTTGLISSESVIDKLVAMSKRKNTLSNLNSGRPLQSSDLDNNLGTVKVSESSISDDLYRTEQNSDMALHR